jgi:hypothetical protein
MNSQIHRMVVAGVLAVLAVIPRAPAAENPFARTDTDPTFRAGLAKVKQSTGFIEDPPGQSSTDWKPNLQLLVGVKALEGSKRTIHFVELTTLRPPLTNAAGRPWQPFLHTNDWAWSATNKAQYISSNYPVRVRVFDETGRQLKGGQVPMAWGTLTNGLFDLCRLGLEVCGNKTNSLTAPASRPAGKGAPKPAEVKPVPPDERVMLATGGGFLWMIGMFSDLQTVPTVADVWGKAQCAIRMPGAWTVLTAPFKGISIDLQLRIDEVTLARAATTGAGGPLYRLPMDLKSGKRQLSRVEMIIGPAHGAEMLLAGIRTIHARHPTNPKQEFVTQVLATGSAREP